MASQAGSHNDKKKFNVDSPAFTPAPLQQSTNLQPPANGKPRGTTISPKAANAVSFTPQSQSTQPPASILQNKTLGSAFYSGQDYQDYDAATYPAQFNAELNNPVASAMGYDAYNNSSAINAIANAAGQMTINPYAHDATQIGSTAYYNGAASFTQPPPQHLYFPSPHRPPHLKAYQKTVHDFFIPESIRDELQRKMDAARFVPSNPSLPVQIEHYYALSQLDNGSHKNDPVFGYRNYVYKAFSKNNDRTYLLRRLEGYRLTDANAINAALPPWKQILSGSMVNIHEAFTTRAFGDSSLIVVTDYHPLAKTLEQVHGIPTSRYGRHQASSVPEATLWGYIVQIGSALKAIHANGLAARTVTASKIIETSSRRIRLSGCGVMDIVQYHNKQDMVRFQQEDLRQLGQLILSISCGLSAPAPKTIDQLPRNWSYSDRLREILRWLIVEEATIQSPIFPQGYHVDGLMARIVPETISVLESDLHAMDNMTEQYSRELSNGRIARLTMKLSTVLERKMTDGSPDKWSETGSRYVLSLFRDYVFHPVDSNGKPLTDMGHMLTCLGKLDSQVDEKVVMTSRDNSTVFVATYKELAKGLEAAWAELTRTAS